MKLYSIYDEEFTRYGRIFEGLEEEKRAIDAVLKKTPVGDGVDYVAEYEPLQSLPVLKTLSDLCYGGMPVELGYCNGHNTRLNCLEYHRDSEFNYGTDDFILLLARMDDIINGKLDTDKVKAFMVPGGVLIEVYATTLHYAPCQASLDKGYQVMIILPRGTNVGRPENLPESGDSRRLLGTNKWLLAHPDSREASEGAYIGLTGENIDITNLIRG